MGRAIRYPASKRIRFQEISSASTFMTDARQLRIIVINSVLAPPGADRDAIERADRARDLRIGLLEGGYNILAALAPEADIETQISRLAPDLIIIDSQSDGVVQRVVVATAHARCPIVCFTEDASQERMQLAIEAGVAAYVVAGLLPDRVAAVLDVAMTRFQVEQKLRQELQDAKLKLEERKFVERAKGLLMERYRCSEEEAYRRLRRFAMERKLKLAEVAQRMIDVADMLA